jgi:hypothetical protein
MSVAITVEPENLGSLDITFRLSVNGAVVMTGLGPAEAYHAVGQSLQRIALAKPAKPPKPAASPTMFDVPKLRSWLIAAASAA